ncbi:hypothetical protein [Halarsenatibacter silvermanii]|uniref:Uncharacterized protein n=1 Tax=Halarsenatibacter silvermanii TaxID=321763 RepID=A0A1G9RII3_9FIRM|nr:hypothetical protein [Halarsenatibacter silvermanii]SDM22677.1 hypothetical protein SAMN04488692_12210 [Halarsenatibacter silvermanii]
MEPAENIEQYANFQTFSQDGLNFLVENAVKISAEEINIEVEKIADSEEIIVYNANFAPELHIKPEKYIVKL